MPLYEYQCTRCGRRVEKIQLFSAEPLRECEACGGPLEKLISAPAIQFKGSGWYITDYSKKSSSPAANGSNKSGSSAEDSGSSESKPAAEASKPAAADAGKSDKSDKSDK